MFRETAGPRAQPSATRSNWWLVSAMAATTYMATLDMTVVTVALPTMTRDLGITPAVSEWLVLAYALPLVGLSLPAGRWIDAAPWRRCLTITLAGFAGSSVIVGLSFEPVMAISSRAVQGMFAALLLALAPAVASHAVRPESRGRAMGLIVAFGSMGAISGYAGGAIILDSVGWPGAFYLNVPVAVAIMAVVMAVMPVDLNRLSVPTADMVSEGIMLLAAAGTLLTSLSLTASHGPAWLALAPAALVPGVIWARGVSGRRTVARLLVPPVRQTHVSLLLESGAFGGATFALPFLLEAFVSGSIRSVGLTLLALPVGAIVGSVIGGVVADRYDARIPAVVGAAVLAVGLAVLALSRPAWDGVDFVWGIAFAGVGAGSFASANQTLAMAAATRDGAAAMGASTNVVRQLGFALGPALVTAIWALADYSTSGLSLGIAAASIASLGAALVLANVTQNRNHQPGPLNAPTTEGTGKESR